MWAVEFTVLLVYIASLVAAVAVLNILVVAIVIWIDDRLHGSAFDGVRSHPRSRAGVADLPSEAPAAAGTLTAPYTGHERRWRP